MQICVTTPAQHIRHSLMQERVKRGKVLGPRQATQKDGVTGLPLRHHALRKLQLPCSFQEQRRKYAKDSELLKVTNSTPHLPRCHDSKAKSHTSSTNLEQPLKLRTRQADDFNKTLTLFRMHQTTNTAVFSGVCYAKSPFHTCKSSLSCKHHPSQSIIRTKKMPTVFVVNALDVRNATCDIRFGFDV